jgi:hypothetical protein
MKKKNTLFVSMKETSTIINEESISLQDGRTIKIQIWQEAGNTFITYFFPIEGLEQKSKEELYQYLLAQGVELELPFSKGKVAVQKFIDEEKQQCWGMTIVAGKIPEI